MDIALVVGLAIELAGGILLAAGVLKFDRPTLRARGGTYPGGGGTREAQEEPGLVLAGLGFFVLGFLIQLAAQIGGDWWLWLVAAFITGAASGLGWWLGGGLIAGWLHERASGAPK